MSHHSTIIEQPRLDVNRNEDQSQGQEAVIVTTCREQTETEQRDFEEQKQFTVDQFEGIRDEHLGDDIAIIENQTEHKKDLSVNNDEGFGVEDKKKTAINLVENEISNNFSRPAHQETTVREEYGIMRVLAEAGYKTIAANVLGEMGLDHADGVQSEDGEYEDDIRAVSSSRWPGPDHRPDLTSLQASGDTGDTRGQADRTQTQDIGNIEPENNKSQGKKDTLTLLLHAFSVRRNLPKIFNITNSAEGDLQCLHGIRFLSMTWVILGHTFFFSLPFVDNPVWALNIIQNSWTMEAVEQGLFSVDSFFFLSGLLVSYIFLKRRSSVGHLTSPLTWMKVILHRYVRLLPPYIALVLLLEPLAFYTCSGPQV